MSGPDVMDPLSPLQAQSLLHRYGVRPRKALGQNFLISAAARETILEAAEIQPGDTVLEIGPGLGALTERMAEDAARVIAVELDASLHAILQDMLANLENVTLIQGDILKLRPDDLGLEPGYVVAANIPYNITSMLIRHLMESKTPASRVVLTIQKEVAERIVAGPGEMSLLALSVQVFGRPSMWANIPSGAFFPAPKVDSAVLRVDMSPRSVLELDVIDTLFTLARAGFAQKRKQLKNSLAHGLPIDKAETETLLKSCGVEPSTRAQMLDVETWLQLARVYRQIENG
ncbi:MAG: 16S rRNA (adenine(1518)-N(6)/adenine(1519)-N(6))-dimethyltransferase RsmA [Anaerolineales bacterium]|nr:16S rRNA (adenine(1518)-N(6)/adenine(1519)-N(6))-dimethyltransferase RsmA [Anaerolineales bacterium]